MAGRPIWDDTLHPDDSASLAPGPRDIDRTPDVLVVGGGIVGLAVAAACGLQGTGRVQLIERASRLAGGSSGRAAGVLSPGTHVTEAEPFRRLAHRSLELHRSLDASWDYGLQTLDTLVVVGEGSQQITDADGTDAVTPSDAAALVPGLGADIGRAVLVRGQARVHPLRMAAAVARHAGRTATEVAYLGHEVEGGRIDRVLTSYGVIEPGAVVFATGVAPDGFAGPRDVVKGHLIATEPAGFGLDVALTSPEVLIVPLPDGSVVCGGTIDDDIADVVRDDVVERIRTEVKRLLPDTSGLRVSHRWSCFRPAANDGMPVIDRIPGVENAWITCGHFRTGLLLAPGTGELVADWIASGRRPAGATGFGMEGVG